MSQILCQSLLANYRAASYMVAESSGQFSPTQWRQGLDSFQVPWKIAYHIVDCLDYYFREPADAAYAWGHRFGGGWWELTEARLPPPAEVRAYLDDIEARIERHFGAIQDEALALPFDSQQEHGATRLGHYVYALRHTLHPHGALSLLSLNHGNPKASWE
jgi:hypothetical protein